MSTFVFVKDGEEFSYSTKAIDVEKTIVVKAKKALWTGVGVRLSVEDLAAIGVQLKHIPTQTAARQQYEHITALYTAVPEFATRVAEWKAMFDELGISYNATVAEIAAAEEAKFGENSTARADFHDAFMGKRTEVLVNYQAAEKFVSGNSESTIDDYTIWTTTADLVKWLPGTYQENEVPALRQPTIVQSSAQEAELVAEDEAIDQPVASN